ncbi:hypothetical protein BKA80DRAFT_146639 [Phyllosticta citrichinensis]
MARVEWAQTRRLGKTRPENNVSTRFLARLARRVQRVIAWATLDSSTRGFSSGRFRHGDGKVEELSSTLASPVALIGRGGAAGWLAPLSRSGGPPCPPSTSLHLHIIASTATSTTQGCFNSSRCSIDLSLHRAIGTRQAKTRAAKPTAQNLILSTRCTVSNRQQVQGILFAISITTTPCNGPSLSTQKRMVQISTYTNARSNYA